MFRSPPSKQAKPSGRLLLTALLCSLLGHLALGTWVGTNLVLPDLEIELQLPSEVELGLSEDMEAASPAAAPEPAPPIPPERAHGEGESTPDAGRERTSAADAGIGKADADQNTNSDADRDRGHSDASLPSLSADAGGPSTRIPKGAQIALRVDMTRIRNSPVANDVRALLAAVPDWQALLDGSNIDPVAQLDRLLLATPNLQRDKIVLAGRYLGGKEVVLTAVQQLAEARGVEARWRTVQGLKVAPWANADATPRVIALVGPSHFTISREEDLPRVLAIAAARAQTRRTAQEHPADALLSMEAQEGISLEIEGVEQFVRRGRRGIPEKARLSAVEVEGPAVELRAQLTYGDAAQAEDALAFWENARNSYARNALVGLLGLSSALTDATLSQRDQTVHITLTLSVEQTRLILGYAQELVAVKPGRGAPGSPINSPQKSAAP